MRGNILLCNQVLINIMRAKVEAMQATDIKLPGDKYFKDSDYKLIVDKLNFLEEEVEAEKDLIIQLTEETLEKLNKEGK